MRIIIFDTETTGLPKKVTKTTNVPMPPAAASATSAASATAAMEMPPPTSGPTKSAATSGRQEEDIPYTVVSQTETIWPHIVQFSYIVYDTTKNEILKISDHVIKLPPGVIIPQECINIHGITNEISLKKGVDIDSVLTKFMKDVLLADKVIAHNMNFDFNMIKAEVHRTMNRSYSHFTRRSVDIVERYKEYLYILANLKEKLYCTMRNSISLCNIKMTTKTGNTFVKFPKLVELHEKLFGAAPKKLHNSLNDVVVCLRCYYQLEFGIDICIMNSKIQRKMSELL